MQVPPPKRAESSSYCDHRTTRATTKTGKFFLPSFSFTRLTSVFNKLTYIFSSVYLLAQGQPVCSFYTTYGSCKFGTACRYDHPLVGYYGYTLPSFSYPVSSVALSNQNTSQMIRTAENASPNSSKLPDQFSKSGQRNLENHEHGNTSADTPSKN